MTLHCPVCTGPVKIVGDREGTNHYEPVSEQEENKQLCVLLAYATHRINHWQAMDAFHDSAIEMMRLLDDAAERGREYVK